MAAGCIQDRSGRVALPRAKVKPAMPAVLGVAEAPARRAVRAEVRTREAAIVSDNWNRARCTITIDPGVFRGMRGELLKGKRKKKEEGEMMKFNVITACFFGGRISPRRSFPAFGSTIF